MVSTDVRRAAKRLVDDLAFKTATERLLSDALNGFTGSAPEDGEARERAYHQHQAIRLLVSEIEGWAKSVD
jgi:hypothetical protein